MCVHTFDWSCMSNMNILKQIGNIFKDRKISSHAPLGVNSGFGKPEVIWVELTPILLRHNIHNIVYSAICMSNMKKLLDLGW